ncbi:MAG: serine hydrolase [Gammaproteobacteria bacterium]|jgi:CubicO group peptidase (beta-lactamase class C family)|nr:serine hydrolase [Gammaproteobacteria bacterium]MDP6732682.1 serine hydrolase [Gammaproteobacteria bacterium]|tara:strand:- start:4836 stop:5921 length:1086 start_codon:yes stop_codon:yes gene_type:complete
MQTAIRLTLSLTLALSSLVVVAAELYFPEDSGDWETVSPESVGWNGELIDAALDLAGERNSSGVLILHRGRILAEQYWDLPQSNAPYQRSLQGFDADGRAIEDVASAQKSVVAVLTGIAQQMGYLKIDDPVSNYLGKGWSKATEQQEVAITVRHLISMDSGLATDFTFEAEPDSKWLYNTPVYHLTMRVLMAATGMERNELTQRWLSEPLGMKNSSWTPRPWANAAIAVGFSTTARELARFGLMIQAGGRWKDQTVINDTQFLEEMLSPSQQLNPAYGFLWWLNGQEFSVAAGPAAARREGQLIPSAPPDLVAMQGAADRKLYLVPSLNLIVTRLGASGSQRGSNFNELFWEALMKAAPTP